MSDNTNVVFDVPDIELPTGSEFIDGIVEEYRRPIVWALAVLKDIMPEEIVENEQCKKGSPVEIALSTVAQSLAKYVLGLVEVEGMWNSLCDGLDATLKTERFTTSMKKDSSGNALLDTFLFTNGECMQSLHTLKATPVNKKDYEAAIYCFPEGSENKKLARMRLKIVWVMLLEFAAKYSEMRRIVNTACAIFKVPSKYRDVCKDKVDKDFCRYEKYIEAAKCKRESAVIWPMRTAHRRRVRL